PLGLGAPSRPTAASLLGWQCYGVGWLINRFQIDGIESARRFVWLGWWSFWPGHAIEEMLYRKGGNMRLQEGDCFGHYRIGAHVAEGGIGDVYRAVDMLTEREVALKIPFRSAILDATRYEQFLCEVEALQVLHHPMIQDYIESGREDNTPFL